MTGEERRYAGEALEAALDVRLHDRELLRRALTHRSYAFEAGGLASNERLEFLGDAVLGLVVTRRLFEDHPDEPEGRLAKLRSATVSTASLADIARGVGVGEAVLLGRGEEQSGGRDKDSILADTLEAVLGAVYLDRGLEDARVVIERLVAPRLADLRGRDASLDYKTALQELVAARGLGQPRYDVEGAGPDHAMFFTAEVEVTGAVIGAGGGTSKKAAEQAAAQQAWAWLSTRYPQTPDERSTTRGDEPPGCGDTQ